MIEKLPFVFNINLLKQDLEQIKKIPITWQAKEFGYSNFGGWSVLSKDGSCNDGWEVGIEQCEGKFYKYQLAKYLKISHPFEHNKKTPACIGEIEKVIDTFICNGFYPRRARITLIKSNTSSIVHIDNPWDDLIENYSCRVHIPIITNKKCTHWTEKGEYHMPANGSSYILPVNNFHQVKNDSNEDRYHLIMDVYDTCGISKTMQFLDKIEKLENSSREFRQKIDEVNLTIFHKIIFKMGKEFYKFKRRYK